MVTDIKVDEWYLDGLGHAYKVLRVNGEEIYLLDVKNEKALFAREYFLENFTLYDFKRPYGGIGESAGPAKIAVGSTVRLKSGGPPMTVEEITGYDGTPRSAGCVWFQTWGENESVMSRLFKIDCIEPVPKESDHAKPEAANDNYGRSESPKWDLQP